MGNNISSFICHEEDELKSVTFSSDTIDVNDKVKTDIYEGEFDIDGKRDGIGKLTFADGSYYHGHFKRNLFDGEGNYVSITGVTYEGGWKDGQRSGKGIVIITNVIITINLSLLLLLLLLLLL